MSLGVKTSAIVSLTLSLMLFSAMQLFKVQLGSSEGFTILGGFLGSVLFMLLLTGINNFESVLFEDYFQAKLFPEVFISVFLSCLASGLIHRVCVTTCFVFSMVWLFYINRISASKYQAPVSAAVQKPKNKKRKH